MKPGKMKNWIFRIVVYCLVFGAAVLLFLIFCPRSYDVPRITAVKGMQYWTLRTGSRISYVFLPAKGQKRPCPVIYLHGGPGGCITDATVERFVPIAENGFDVYLYDQVGSGHSARLENIEEYTAERHKRDLEEIVKKTGSQRVILIGQSWGAILATLFVADNPDKTERLIFTGPGPIYPPKREMETLAPPDSLHLRKPLYSNWLAGKKVENLRTRTVFLLAKIFGWKLASDNEMDDFQTALSAETNRSMVCDTSRTVKAKGGGGYYVRILTMRSLYELPDPRAKLVNCRVPLFIMRGQCDNQAWGAVAEYLDFFPCHRLVIIPGAGHGISIEQPGLYLETMLAFLTEPSQLK
jgi:proline iminopeptidase